MNHSSRSSSYRRRGRRRGNKIKWLFGLIIIIIGAYWIASVTLPNREHVNPDWKVTHERPIFAEGELMAWQAMGSGDALKLPLPVIQSVIDPNIRYEEDTKSVILTTSRKLVFLKTDEKVGKINNKPIQLAFAPEEKEGVLYLPAHLLKEIYGAEIYEDVESGTVLLMKAGETVQKAQVLNASGKKDYTVPLRQEASIHTPILADMPDGTNLRILDTVDDWYYAQLDNGYSGFVKKKDVSRGEEITIPKLEQETSPAKEKWQSKTVNLTWEAVYQVAPKPSTFGEMPGINVVSPTWFSLMDGSGNVRSKADSAYVKWAHGKGIQVWGLFSNSFEPDLTTEALSNFENRMNTILQMLHYAKIFDLDGINIDYENVYTKDGDNLTQFMRELWPLAQEQGLVVSIDVTPKSNSEMWSAFLDRRALSEVVDYLILMAYDEHWAASQVAGSVASLPWAGSAATRILEEDNVSPDKLILAIPLYTRVWTEIQKDGKTVVSSKAIGMKKAQDIIKDKKLKPKFLEDTGQNYVEYSEDGALYRIWLEDKESLARRVELAKSLQLAGIATWTRSFASEDAWEVLNGIME
ncbi:glycoside hydrolase [Paenibacillus segetis]|uniref:Glycoside hydrolase n=1 Tax=Paenibacillus segetis TaxID=1325360 RepID=A0ABQ1YUA1_9BACL|nr:glycosyl hydrolase family 18 protein [Paenibacillus segetis]GGH38785.1 glycoside hydrolase [Paenibacillus segetis]